MDYPFLRPPGHLLDLPATTLPDDSDSLPESPKNQPKIGFKIRTKSQIKIRTKMETKNALKF